MTEDQRRMRAAVETIENQEKQIKKIEHERNDAQLSAVEKDKVLDHLQERICRLEMCLDSGISLSRELSTLLSCNDHEVARWKDSAYEAIERFDRRLHEYGTYMGKIAERTRKRKSNGCWNPETAKCDCPACGGFND